MLRRTLPLAVGALCAFWVSSAWAQSAINMSHDLVSLGIAAQNLNPDQPQLDAAPLFQAAINYAGANHVPYVTLDTGAYYFRSTGSPIAYIDISDISGLTIDLAGSTIWFNEPQAQGFHLFNCTHVTLKNFVIDYVTLPFTQVQLTSVDAANRRLLYSTLPGWPDPVQYSTLDGSFGQTAVWAIAFRNGTIVPGTSRMGVARPIAEGVLTLSNPNSFPFWLDSATLTLQPGDIIAVTLRQGNSEPIDAIQDDSIVITNVAIYASAGPVMILANVSNTVVDHVSIMPRPGSDHLVASTAGGIHFVDTVQNDVIRNCFVTRTIDDGLIMESQNIAFVTAQLGQRQLQVTRQFTSTFPNGTLVDVVDPLTGVETVAGVIVDQSPPDSSVPVSNGVVDITLDRDVTAQAGAALTYGSDLLRGVGSVIEDNTVVDLMAGRAIWIGGSRGITIHRNVLDTTSDAGISIESYGGLSTGTVWPTAASLVIDSNVVRNAPGPMNGGMISAVGGIQVDTLNQDYSFGPDVAEMNVTISSNFVTDSGRTGIWIGELNGGLVQNNIVTRWNRQALPLPMRPIDVQLVQPDLSQPLAVHYSTGVQLVSNTFVPDSPVTQAVALSAASQSLSQAVFSGALTVTPNLANFNWRAVSDSSWLTITGNDTGTGPGSISYTVSANTTGASRTGTLTIAGVVFPITQTATSAAPPTITQQPARLLAGAGQTGHFAVAVAPDPTLQYRWQVSMDGQTWVDLAEIAPYSGTATATLTIAAITSSLTGLRFHCLVSDTGGTTTSLAAQLIVTVPPALTFEQPFLTFGAVRSGNSLVAVTAAQDVPLIQEGLPNVSWTATPSVPWIRVSPASGTGEAVLTVSVVFDPSFPLLGGAAGLITVQAAGTSQAVPPLTVNVNVEPVGLSGPPFGSFDTPATGTTGIAGSIPVTGWALDVVQVTRVTICRDVVAGEESPVDPTDCAGNAKIYIGDAVFVDGARPDVQAANPTLPLNSRGGWGYLMLTNFLPNLGNGTFNLEAYAYGAEGLTTLLGTKTITCANASSVAPFGAIDTPGQGASVSGSAFANFGWVLAPGPNFADPPDGGTVQVFVDGAVVGSPAGWTSRADLTAAFTPPGTPLSSYPGISRALGVYGLDTTTLSNGLHTIFWIVTGTGGSGTSGIGSRFFTVSNGSEQSTSVSAPWKAATVIPAPSKLEMPASVKIASLDTEVAAAPLNLNPIQGRRGFDVDRPLQTYTPSSGRLDVQAEELDRIELHLNGTPNHQFSGYLLTPSGLKPLPVGSALNASTGTFTWAPGVGFYGPYDLTFVQWNGGHAIARQDVRVTLNAKGSNRVGPQTIIDVPGENAVVGSPFYVGGWAADLDSSVDSGVSTVHVWAYPVDEKGDRLDPIFLGPAIYGGARPDVGAVYGDRFGNSGYGIIVNSLQPGTYDIAVFAYSTVIGEFTPAKIVRITLQ